MAPHVDHIRVSGGSSVSPTTVQAQPHVSDDGHHNENTKFKATQEFSMYNPSLSPGSTTSSACDSGVESVGHQEQVNVKYTSQHVPNQYIQVVTSQSQPQFRNISAYQPALNLPQQYILNGMHVTPQYYSGAPVCAIPAQYPVLTSELNGGTVPVGQPLSVDIEQQRMVPQMIPMVQNQPLMQPFVNVPYNTPRVPEANSLDSSFSEGQSVDQAPQIFTVQPVVPHQVQQFIPYHPPQNTQQYSNVQPLPVITLPTTESPAPEMTGITQPIAKSPNHGCVAPKSLLEGTPSPAAMTPTSMKSDDCNVSVSRTLEKVWEKEFHGMFSRFPHPWSINPSLTIPPRVPCTSTDPELPEMKTFMDSAKVRFICPSCNHCWTSMKGRVRFGYEIDEKSQSGLVVFKLYGQKCQKCNGPDWVHAMWYPEEIRKAIYNVCQKVGQAYYNWTKPVVRLDRRGGRPSKPHDTTSCQACSEGICKEERNFV